MASRRIRLTIDSDPAAVGLVGAAAHGICSAASLPEPECARVELCVVEAVTNSIRHAYHGRPEGRVEVDFVLGEGTLAIEVVDRGTPMAAGTLERAHLDEDAAEQAAADLAEGGRGLGIIKAVMDEAAYRSSRGVNTLVMTKRWPRESF